MRQKKLTEESAAISAAGRTVRCFSVAASGYYRWRYYVIDLPRFKLDALSQTGDVLQVMHEILKISRIRRAYRLLSTRWVSYWVSTVLGCRAWFGCRVETTKQGYNL
jgi:hypothetical protein